MVPQLCELKNLCPHLRIGSYSFRPYLGYCLRIAKQPEGDPSTHCCNASKSKRKRMPLPANPSQRMSDTDTVLHRLKSLLFVIFSGVLATVPTVMAHAESNVSTNTSAGVTSQQDVLNANYAATRLAGLESLDERLPDNLFTVEAVIFKRVDTQTALLALAKEDPTSVSPSLDVREPLLLSLIHI